MAGSRYPPPSLLLFLLSSLLLIQLSSSLLSFPSDQQAAQNSLVYPEGAGPAALRDSALEKRRTSFRSDLGKRDVIVDNQSEPSLESLDIDREGKGHSESDLVEDKRARFRSDLGKRRYRVDLGKKSSAMLGDQVFAMDDQMSLGDHGDVLFDNGIRGDEEKRARFRSDLGKRMSGGSRPTWWTGKRVFRSDLGKRRYRTDLG